MPGFGPGWAFFFAGCNGGASEPLTVVGNVAAADGVGVAALDSEGLFERAGATMVLDDGVEVDDEDALRGLTGAMIS